MTSPTTSASFSNSTTPTDYSRLATGSLRPLRVLKDNKEITERLKDYRLRREEFIKIPKVVAKS